MKNRTFTAIALFLIAMLTCCAIVGGAYAAYLPSSPNVQVSISAQIPTQSWNGTLTLDLSSVSWFENDDCRASVFITYTDSTTNAAYPGEPMTRTSARHYSYSANGAKTVQSVVFVRTNNSAIYMYNKTDVITTIPNDFNFVLTANDFNEITLGQRTTLKAVSFNITWQYFNPDASLMRIYLWYSDESHIAWPGDEIERTENNYRIYTADLSKYEVQGKDILGFLVVRCNKDDPTDVWNKSDDFYIYDIGSTRIITVSDMWDAN